jgi:diguanylate cyclase (GGDEF)-like protein
MSYSPQSGMARQPSNTEANPPVVGRLLIVDDVADNRAILTRRFQRRGFEIVEADCGAEALRLIGEQTFDCVLLDVMMPGMDGTEALRRIREKFAASLLPVIMVTAKSQSEDVVEALKLGANDYITKPVDFSVALARVNSQIDRRRAELELLETNKSLLSEKSDLQQRIVERSAKLLQAKAEIEQAVARRTASEDRITYLAHHDMLTGLPNRFAFDGKLKASQQFAEESHSQISLLFIDLDGFKNVNDTLGHGIGDKLLKQVADRLREVAGEKDFCARLGGDEFAIIHVSKDALNTAVQLAEKIIATLSGAHDLDASQVFIGASVGIATLSAGDKDTSVLLRRADLAMYRAKAEGRGTYRVFEPEMAVLAELRRKFETDMREATENGAFELYYQPIVDLKSGKVMGLEALMRWSHGTRGSVSPAEFIPLAEETGLIVQLGEWAIRRACADAAKWPGNLRVAVNLSPVQFRDTNLPTVVVDALSSSGLPANRLELEITEGVMLGNNMQNVLTLEKLRDLGVRISIDDFGTGFSGLGYLRAFPFDKVKIDQSFVREMDSNLESMAIIRASIGLGSNLGMCITAEGVESLDQCDELLKEGCTEVQGFLFGQARPNSDVVGMIEEIERRTDLQCLRPLPSIRPGRAA